MLGATVLTWIPGCLHQVEGVITDIEDELGRVHIKARAGSHFFVNLKMISDAFLLLSVRVRGRIPINGFIWRHV